ncbi:hypothetical protein [Algoriphagus boritolerans]|uniref:Uncharacterized protein n=1 Tax=Algoriphagus boritolerans DSM 17298 = JCM 18970 TaxID=1120964 RepID=A0A1H5WP26_9BACT|nr:hypothetical protein [Algoriphagus boritolerans]SEG00747.1 hypothetical protein SAMN03080598_02169 [Algoriphagus boritolerans DSM 17298 = JCM 18970]
MIILIFFSGCSFTEHNDPIISNELEISNKFNIPKGLDFKSVVNIGQELGKVLGRDQKLNAFAFSMDYSEPEIEGVLNPLVENGRDIHQQLLNQINTSPVWNTLSEEDKQSIICLSDQELAELSFIISVTNQITSTTADWDRIRSCASGALGIGVVNELVKNTAALASAEVAAEILVLVGKRTLGWVALGLVIWDFYDCVK